MIAYAVTIFLGAFLLFQVQPLIGKFILPWFGGTPAVWTTCMLFFQVLLLGGYAYAHATTVGLSRRRQVLLHLVLLLASLILLPIMPSAEKWKPTGPEHPTAGILLLLAVCIGGPYFLLSATSPLLQRWFHLSFPNRSPYRLYSLSNAGSLIALITYPFVVERMLRLSAQGWVWTSLYGTFVLVCGYCGVRLIRRRDDESGEVAPAETTVAGVVVDEHGAPATTEGDEHPGWGRIVLWLALSACGSLVLLATTNQLCQEVAVVPFLWVLPLALYLITFIVCFDSPKWYKRPVFGTLLFVALALAAAMLFLTQDVRLQAQIYVYSGTLFIACMVCHGELVRLKPSPRRLTLFYLMVSLGGALGGVFVVLVAPLLFNGYWEYHLALAVTLTLMIVTFLRREKNTKRPMEFWWGVAGLVVVVPLTAVLLVHILFEVKGAKPTREGLKQLVKEGRLAPNTRVVASTRNFYGVLRVLFEQNEAGVQRLRMKHGVTTHGFQLQGPQWSRLPTAFYSPMSGVGVTITRHPRRTSPDGDRSLRIGVVGLGVGTLASYGREGDVIRFYEINPAVVRLCNTHFTFIRESSAQVDIVLGDGRIMLEQELARGEPQGFDVLVVDAFNSDAIPMHLLTLEAAEVYRKHLKPDGILAFHISNRYLNLFRVVGAIARHLNCMPLYVPNREMPGRGAYAAEWILITRNQAFLNDPVVNRTGMPWPPMGLPFIAWTDDYGSLWQVMKE